MRFELKITKGGQTIPVDSLDCLGMISTGPTTLEITFLPDGIYDDVLVNHSIVTIDSFLRDRESKLQ